nr:hypothetical protein [uncultured Holophaga sp.]
MNPHMRALPLIVFGVLLNAFAQIAMKKAILAQGMEWSFMPLVRLILHPWMLTCLCCYALSVLVWAAALRHVAVNFAYPFLALGFLANAFMARAFLGERIPLIRWVALLIIMAGIGLQAYSGASASHSSSSSESPE